MKIGKQTVSVFSGENRVDFKVGEGVKKESVVFTLRLPIGGPDGHSGWSGILKTKDKNALPKTNAECKSLYNYSGSGSQYTVNDVNFSPISWNNNGDLYIDNRNGSIDIRISCNIGESVSFVIFNHYWLGASSSGGFATCSFIADSSEINGKIVRCGKLIWRSREILSYNFKTSESSIVNPFPYKYVQMAYNYCTLSYTMALWTEKEWEEELNRIKNAGFTHVLVNAGLEEVWYKYLLSEGFSQEDAIAFIPDSTHRAWWAMGNLEGEFGPISLSQIKRQGEIGRFICNFCWDNGIVPVVNAFTGVVPHKWLDYFPNDRIIPARSKWCGYERPYQLDPTNSYTSQPSTSFRNHAKKYHKALFDVYGIDENHRVDFSGDPFHEGFNPAWPSGLTATPCAVCMQTVQQEALPGSVWFLQHWQTNPTQDLLNGCIPELTLVQKLYKNMASSNVDVSGYGSFGEVSGSIPWIEALVVSFGDRPNMYGNLGLVKSTKNAIDKKINGCIGYGLLDEGISYNSKFYPYISSILGKTERPEFYGASWIELLDSVYNVTNSQEGPTEGVLVAEPHFGLERGSASTWSASRVYWDTNKVINAAKIILNELKTNPEKFDDKEWVDYLILIFKQVISDKFTSSNRNMNSFVVMDQLLDQSRKWKLYDYWKMCESKATYKNVVNEQEALKFYRDWICLLTSWKQADTTNSSGLLDYSNRHLSGMMDAYYGERWRMYNNGSSKSEIITFSSNYWKNVNKPAEPNKLDFQGFVSLLEQILQL